MTKVRCTIRINGDGSSDTVIPEQAVAPVDDDWIEVELTIGADDDLTYQLRRMTTDLNVYRGDTREEIVFDGEYMGTGNLVYTFADASEVPDSVWVEWTSDAHSNPPDPNSHYFGPQLVLQALVDPNHVGIRTEDVLVFHTFHSMVMAIAGDTSNPFRSGATDHGVYKIAKDMYARGWDAYVYAEDKNDPDAADENGNLPPVDWRDGVDVAVAGIDSRGVESIAIFGHSHGGGATYKMAEDLVAKGKGGHIAYTAYVDAVTWGGLSAQDERPPGTAYHVNFYQENGWPDGAYIDDADINIEVNEDVDWPDPGTDENDGEITHTEIDNVAEIHDLIKFGGDGPLTGASDDDIEGIEDRLSR